MLKMFFITGVGGFLGSGCRYLVQRLSAHYLPVSFPFGTLFINVTGCLLIGFLFAAADRSRFFTPEIRMFLIIGLCGGFTTFSTFTLDAYHLLKGGQYLYVSVYIVLSVTLGILATIAGIWIIKSIWL